MSFFGNKTPEDYIGYLKERNYSIIVDGGEVIVFRAALDTLAMYYKVKTVLTDSGGGIARILIKEVLADEVTLLISPVIVG